MLTLCEGGLECSIDSQVDLSGTQVNTAMHHAQAQAQAQASLSMLEREEKTWIRGWNIGKSKSRLMKSVIFKLRTPLSGSSSEGVEGWQRERTWDAGGSNSMVPDHIDRAALIIKKLSEAETCSQSLILCQRSLSLLGQPSQWPTPSLNQARLPKALTLKSTLILEQIGMSYWKSSGSDIFAKQSLEEVSQRHGSRKGQGYAAVSIRFSTNNLHDDYDCGWIAPHATPCYWQDRNLSGRNGPDIMSCSHLHNQILGHRWFKC